jgi:hypothetical protein
VAIPDTPVGLARKLRAETEVKMMTGSIVYFSEPGRENSSRAIRTVVDRVAAGGIDHVVVASGSGETAVACLEALRSLGVRVVCVTHHVGFKEGDDFELDPARAEILRGGGVPIVTASHALSGVGRSLSTKFGGVTPVEIIAHTLRLFGQGMKVCVEIAVMAADAGAIPTDRDVIAIGGTKGGADTAIVLRAAHMNRFLDLRIREVLCVPRDG